MFICLNISMKMEWLKNRRNETKNYRMGSNYFFNVNPNMPGILGDNVLILCRCFKEG